MPRALSKHLALARQLPAYPFNSSVTSMRYDLHKLPFEAHGNLLVGAIWRKVMGYSDTPLLLHSE